MSKLILTVFVVAVAISIWSMLRKSKRAESQKKTNQAPPQLRQMARCAVCGAQVDMQLTVKGPQGPQCMEHGKPPGKARP